MIEKLSVPAKEYIIKLELQRDIILNPEKYPKKRLEFFKKVCERTNELNKLYNGWLKDAKYKKIDTSIEEREVTKREKALANAFKHFYTISKNSLENGIKELQAISDELSKTSSDNCDEKEYNDAFMYTPEGSEDETQNLI